jgi:hypothetical protein
MRETSLKFRPCVCLPFGYFYETYESPYRTYESSYRTYESPCDSYEWHYGTLFGGDDLQK